MDQLMRKFGKSLDIDEVLSERGSIDPQDSILADDTDAFRQSTEKDIDITLSLKLSESTNNLSDESYQREKDKNGPAAYSQVDAMLEEPCGKGQTVFEIMSADTIKEGRSTFVMYKILLTKASSSDKALCVVERRYSDFEKLHAKLKKSYPKTMEGIAFPKKLLLGNFSSETIARRSRAFEQYLSHIYSLDRLRFSKEFATFFYLSDLHLAYNKIMERNYIEAVSLLLNVIPLQEKLQGDWSPSVGISLCALVTCYETMDKTELALKYGEAALNCFAGNEQDKHYIPLIHTCIHLCWKLGKNKQHLEAKLSGLAGRNTHEEDIESLMTVVLKDNIATSPQHKYT